MKRKFVFFDIDGTLTDRSNNEVVPSARAVLRKLQENGHLVAIATGRAYYKAKGLMEDLGITEMVCYGGGGIVIDSKLLYMKPLNRENVLKIYDEACEKGYGTGFLLEDSINLYSSNNLFVEQTGGRKEPTKMVIDPSFDPHQLRDIYKIYVACPIAKEKDFQTRDLVGHIRFEKEYLTYQYDAKDQGIIEMVEYYKGDLSDVIVFGDDENDEVMFRKEWTSIAMGNATERLKAKADFVTKRNVDDGIEYALKTFGLI